MKCGGQVVSRVSLGLRLISVNGDRDTNHWIDSALDHILQMRNPTIGKVAATTML